MLGSDCLQGSVSAVAVLSNRSRSITAAAGCLLAKFIGEFAGLRSGWHILRLRSLGVAGRHMHMLLNFWYSRIPTDSDPLPFYGYMRDIIIDKGV